MASNHTENCAITDSIAINYLWPHLKRNSGISVKQALDQCLIGGISSSNILEQIISEMNPKLKRSNIKGQDFVDGSDAKFTRARDVHNGKGYNFNSTTITKSALKNKKGTLRIFIPFYDSRTLLSTVYMFKIPYPIWKKRMVKAGVKFGFSKEGKMTPVTQEKWGEFLVTSLKELAK